MPSPASDFAPTHLVSGVLPESERSFVSPEILGPKLRSVELGPSRDGATIADESGAGAARLAAIKHDVLGSLDRGGPRIGSVAVRQGITPRYVQMLFQADGTTFSQFVLEQRLLRAHRLLRDRRCGDWTISGIAYEAGFGDLSYFNRSFRRRFGATPSAIRASSSHT